MITALVIYDLPDSISREDCLAHFHKIAPGFLEAPGFVRKQFIYGVEGEIAGGAYMWETLEQAKAFYSGAWLKGIVERYGNAPRITYFETFAITDREKGVSFPITV